MMVPIQSCANNLAQRIVIHVFIKSLRYTFHIETRYPLIPHMYEEKLFKNWLSAFSKWALTSFTPFLVLVLPLPCPILEVLPLHVDISGSAWVSHRLYNNPAMFMPSLLMFSHLSPCWGYSSVSSATKGQPWWPLRLLLVVLKGTSSLSSADGADSFIPPEQQVGQNTEGKKQTKQVHAWTLGKKTRMTHPWRPIWPTHFGTSSLYLSLTEVPGHSVPEAETCRVLHRCE